MSDGEHRRFSPFHTWDELYSEEPHPHWSSLMDIPHIHVCQVFIHCPPKQDFLNLMLFPSYSTFSCWLLSQIFPICLWNFHSLLSNPLSVALLWTLSLPQRYWFFFCHAKSKMQLSTLILSEFSLLPLLPLLHKAASFFAQNDTGVYKAGISASAFTSLSCILNTAARVILVHESQVMSHCYYFRARTKLLYVWISEVNQWNLADTQ